MKLGLEHTHVLSISRQVALLVVLSFVLQPVFCVALTRGSTFVSEASSFEESSRSERLLTDYNGFSDSKRQNYSPGAVITVNQPNSCPTVNASASTTKTTGPNGSLFFLTCGISATDQYNGGWTPPIVHIDQLVIGTDFSVAQIVNSSVLRPCVPFYDAFRDASAAVGVPPVLLAALAMQESGCNPYATGSGGTAGLLQLSPDKCTNANCYDPFTNISLGAKFLKYLLDLDPNIVLAVGSWNGWYKGMKYADVTAARSYSCYSQQNLDYLQQYFNGWLQNVNPYGAYGGNDRLGFYFNLDVCEPGPLPTWGVSSGLGYKAPIYWWIYLSGFLVFLV